jgi:hypothetical protein
MDGQPTCRVSCTDTGADKYAQSYDLAIPQSVFWRITSVTTGAQSIFHDPGNLAREAIEVCYKVA